MPLKMSKRLLTSPSLRWIQNTWTSTSFIGASCANADYRPSNALPRPIAFKKDENVLDKELTANPYPTWQKLEELVDKGKVRNIGISKCVVPVAWFFSYTDGYGAGL